MSLRNRLVNNSWCPGGLVSSCRCANGSSDSLPSFATFSQFLLGLLAYLFTPRSTDPYCLDIDPLFVFNKKIICDTPGNLLPGYLSIDFIYTREIIICYGDKDGTIRCHLGNITVSANLQFYVPIT